MSDIHQVLTSNEQKIWEGRPQFLPFVFSALPIAIIGFAWGAFLLSLPGWTWSTIILTPHFWFGVVFGPGSLLYTILVHRFVHYIITDKRTLVQSGLIGRDILSIDHDQVTSIQVNVGVIDKLFGKNSGTVRITHAGGRVSKKGNPRPDVLASIDDPYKVYQMLNKVSHDVRADIQYPNAMRPGENTGYQTGYRGDQR